jgi:hypothetical protein
MSRANIEIVQLDPVADSVNVYKKNVYTSVTDVDEYRLVGNFSVKASDKSLLVAVDAPINNAIVYRVVPVIKGLEGFEFTNVVVKPLRFSEMKAVSLTASIAKEGIDIEVRRIPSAVVAVQLMRKNHTTSDRDWTMLTAPTLIDKSTRMSDIVVFNDNAVKASNVYEYAVHATYRAGTSTRMGTETIEYVKPNPGKVDIKTSNLVVSHDPEPNVSFDVLPKLIDTDASTLKNLLEVAGIKEYFNADIEAQRDKLNGILAYSVQRIDLLTGQRDDFGVITSSRFSDDELRKINGIDQLKLGRSYRYIISALFRAPETMFDEFKKTVKDPITKRTYSYYPAKFMHPLALTEGVLVSSQGLKTRYAKSPMSHGELGTYAKVDVSFDSQPSLIMDASVTKFDRDTNVITWKVHGVTNVIDHFLISTEVHGVKTMIGKAHSSFPTGVCQYLHQIDSNNLGDVRYVITPVMNDYTVGQSVSTNSIIIEAV